MPVCVRAMDTALVFLLKYTCCLFLSGDQRGQVLSEHYEVLPHSASGQQPCKDQGTDTDLPLAKHCIMLLCVFQVYRSVLISEQKRCHSGSNKQNSSTEQDPGMKHQFGFYLHLCVHLVTV